MFVGVLTNAIFGLLLGVTRKDGRGANADQAVFVGMNVGLVGFVISLLSDQIWLERASTPLMGASILTGLAIYTMRLASREATESAERTERFESAAKKSVAVPGHAHTRGNTPSSVR